MSRKQKGLGEYETYQVAETLKIPEISSENLICNYGIFVVGSFLPPVHIYLHQHLRQNDQSSPWWLVWRTVGIRGRNFSRQTL